MEPVYSPSGVPYYPLYKPQEYSETFAKNANQIVNWVSVGWDDAGDLKADLMESAAHVAGRKWLTRTLPQRCPWADFQYLTDMRSPGGRTRIRDKGDGSPGQGRDETSGWFTADRIEYMMTYGNLPYLVKDDDAVKSAEIPELERYAVFSYQSVLQNRVLSSYPFVLDEDTTKSINETASIPEVIRRVSVTQHFWPMPTAVNWAVIDSRAGKVNDASITIDGVTYPAETLRYSGLAGPPEVFHGAGGERYANITHLFEAHPITAGWNKVRKPDGTYVYFKVNDGASPPNRRYQKASMKEVFYPR
jgi:hypothetical protein